jgi:hypothetical protein
VVFGGAGPTTIRAAPGSRCDDDDDPRLVANWPWWCRSLNERDPPKRLRRRLLANWPRWLRVERSGWRATQPTRRPPGSSPVLAHRCAPKSEGASILPTSHKPRVRERAARATHRYAPKSEDGSIGQGNGQPAHHFSTITSTTHKRGFLASKLHL